MDTTWLSRSEKLIGQQAIEKLNKSHVMIIGLGGVGSYAAEFICRAGVGEMTIVDGDVVDPTNRNRQLPALATNHGISKAEIMADRLMAINPELKLHVVKEFIVPETLPTLIERNPDYAIDAIDSITPKLAFIKLAFEKKIPWVSSMGAGGKMDPTQLKVADISETYHCKLAFYIRKNLRKIGIRSGVKVVFSTEQHDKLSLLMTDGTHFKKSAYGTISYLPAAFGGVVASVTIRDLIGK